MSSEDSSILYQNGRHWVRRHKEGFEVYRDEGTHSVRCAIIAYPGERGLNRAIQEADKRELLYMGNYGVYVP